MVSSDESGSIARVTTGVDGALLAEQPSVGTKPANGASTRLASAFAAAPVVPSHAGGRARAVSRHAGKFLPRRAGSKTSAGQSHVASSRCKATSQGESVETPQLDSASFVTADHASSRRDSASTPGSRTSTADRDEMADPTGVQRPPDASGRLDDSCGWKLRSPRACRLLFGGDACTGGHGCRCCGGASQLRRSAAGATRAAQRTRGPRMDTMSHAIK